MYRFGNGPQRCCRYGPGRSIVSKLTNSLTRPNRASSWSMQSWVLADEMLSEAEFHQSVANAWMKGLTPETRSEMMQYYEKMWRAQAPVAGQRPGH